MKKSLVFAVILALLLPAAAFAATEFTLGGFVKLDSFWDSSQAGKNMNTPILRDNDPNFHQGRMKFTAQGSRFNFTIKGPKLWGAQTTGFIEMDFDTAEEGAVTGANAFGTTTTAGNNASNNYTPRLRHAMFRLNWPTTELLFGQYWSMFCEFYNESVQDGPLQNHGMPTARLPQIRVTQNLGSGFSVAGLVGNPTNVGAVPGFNATFAAQNFNTFNNGQNSETPQIQGKLQYAQDLWGKAAYYGTPMPFTARVIGGWQRVNMRQQNAVALNTFGQDAYVATLANINLNHQYLDPWMLMANVFVPVIPTHSANLAGTASLSGQWYVGQGLVAFGEGLAGTAYAEFNFRDGITGRPLYDQKLYQQYGGYVQGQYYFTNHWFANVTWSMSKLFGVNRGTNAAITQAGAANNQAGYVWAGGDAPNFWQEVDFTLWYRPITAIKFGLQYAWQQTTWLQTLATPLGAGQPNTSNSGTSSRVEFVGFFYF